MPARRDMLRAAAAAALPAPIPRGKTKETPIEPAFGPLPAGLFPQRNRFRDLADLSGLWEFQPDLEARGAAAGWAHGLPEPRLIAVPGSWNEQFPELRDWCGLCWYLTRIELPESWQDRRLILRAGSANYAARLYIDGALLGEHQGGHLPFAFDATGRLQPGRRSVVALAIENLLLPDRVPPAGLSAPDQAASRPDVPFDFFPFAGLHRPVVLCGVPDVHLTGLRVVTEIDGRDGLVRLTAGASAGWSGNGTARLVTAASEIAVPLVFRDGAAGATLHVPDARLWRPGDAHLYPLTVTLADNGGDVDEYTIEIGIRTVAVRGDALLLNNEPIGLRGFGRHEDFPVNGRGLNVPVAVADLARLRWCGANSFRTSHYPYAEETLQLADRAGVLVIGETPAVGLRFGDAADLVAARLAQTRRDIAELIARDANHPCVVMWSIANEPQPEGGGAFFGDLFAHLRGLDPSRPVTIAAYGGTRSDWFAECDVVSVNEYKGWYAQPGDLDRAAALLGDALDALHDAYRKPIMLTEFGADAIAGMHAEPPAMWSEEYQAALIDRYLDVIAARPFVIGAHVWNLTDFRTAQAIHRPGGLNHKGVFTRDRQPKLAAHRLRARWAGLG